MLFKKLKELFTVELILKIYIPSLLNLLYKYKFKNIGYVIKRVKFK